MALVLVNRWPWFWDQLVDKNGLFRTPLVYKTQKSIIFPKGLFSDFAVLGLVLAFFRG